MNNPCLQVQDLSMNFGGIAALTQLNLSVEKGKITSIIGPNGAGKTTLFNCITGFYTPHQGQIFFVDAGQSHSLGKLLGERFKLNHLWQPKRFIETLYYKMFGGSYKVARLGIARTFQNIRLFSEMSVVENLLVAQHLTINRNLISGILNTQSYQKSLNQAIERAYYWLDLFHLSEDGNRLAGELPYGKQRHLEIARSLCTDPKLICLDEPAAGLNPSETAELADLIVTLRQKQDLSILLIEHDMSMVMKISDEIIVLDHGEKIAQGSPEHTANDPKVIEAYLGPDFEQDQGVEDARSSA